MMFLVQLVEEQSLSSVVGRHAIRSANSGTEQRIDIRILKQLSEQLLCLLNHLSVEEIFYSLYWVMI